MCVWVGGWGGGSGNEEGRGVGGWWLVGWLVGIKARAFICGYKHFDAKAHSSASPLRETTRNNQERASALPSGALMSGTVQVERREALCGSLWLWFCKITDKKTKAG